MHTFKGKGGTRVHHNSDCSGDAIVTICDGAELRELHVPCEDLIEFARWRTDRDKLDADDDAARDFIAGYEWTIDNTDSALPGMVDLPERSAAEKAAWQHARSNAPECGRARDDAK